MRALCAKQSTTTRSALTIFTVGLALLLATGGFATNSSIHADDHSSDGVTITEFIGGRTYTNPDEWLLEGFVTAGDPTAVTIEFEGAASGSASVDSNGYFFAVVLGVEGIVYAIATYGSETAEAQTELGGSS